MGMERMANKKRLPLKWRLFASRIDEAVAYIVLILPAAAIYVLVVIVPLLVSAAMSVSNYRTDASTIRFNGLYSYISMFTYPGNPFFLALKNNLRIALVSVFVQVPLSFIIAYILFRKPKGAGVFQALICLPSLVAPVIVGVLFRRVLPAPQEEAGLFVEIARTFLHGAEPMLAVLMVIVWMSTGMYVMIFLAAMQRVDTSILEAAEIEGAGSGAVLRRIVLPAISGVIAVCVIIALSASLKSFDMLYTMTGGGPSRQTSVLALFMFDRAFKTAPNYPLAAAVSTSMLLASLILTGAWGIIDMAAARKKRKKDVISEK
jgi:raffinose/stachyose/melibiose transport system permease protein